MNTIKKTILAAALITISFVSCKKNDEQIIQNKSNTEIQLINGILVFENKLIFSKHLNWIIENEGNIKIIDEFNRKVGFNSFHSVYDNGMKILNPDELKVYIDRNKDCFKKISLSDNSVFWEMPMSSCLSYIANSQGVYQIGKKVYRNTEDFCLITEDMSKLPNLINTSLALIDPSIEKISTKVSSNKGMYSYRTEYFPSWSDRRIVARLYCNLVDQMYYYEARTTSQQTWNGIWVQAKIHKIIQYNNIGYYCTNSSGTPSIPINENYDEKDDEADFIRTIFFTPYEVYFGFSSCQVHHEGIRWGESASIDKNELFPKN